LRWNYRIKKKIGNRNFTFFVMISETQTLKGITSQVLGKTGYHYPLFDIENPKQQLTLETVERELGIIQVKYNQSDFFITSDKKESYRAYCFNEVKFTDYLRMQLDLIDVGILDYNFFWWTVNKSKATLRVSPKKNRPKQELLSTLHSYSVPIPEKFESALYDTGLDKRGFTVFLGEKGRVIWGNK